MERTKEGTKERTDLLTLNKKEEACENLYLLTVETLKKSLEERSSHQDIKNAIEFLKNNNINCDIRKGDTPLGILNDLDLPYTETDEDMN